MHGGVCGEQCVCVVLVACARGLVFVCAMCVFLCKGDKHLGSHLQHK